MAMMVPVPVVPTVVMPVMMVPVVVVMPAHLFGLDLVDLVLRHDGGIKLYRRLHDCRSGRNRQHGSGLRDRRKRNDARHQSKTDLQNIPALHDFMPLRESETARSLADRT